VKEDVCGIPYLSLLEIAGRQCYIRPTASYMLTEKSDFMLDGWQLLTWNANAFEHANDGFVEQI
jgi:hypothetical protein